jgi:hypothetical protein
MANPFKGLKDRRESVPLVGVAFDGNQNIERAVIVDDAQVSASRVACGLSIAAGLVAHNV